MYAQQKPAMTYLDDLPATSKLVVELLLHSRDDSSIVALLNAVFRTHNNFTRLRVPEEEHFLCRKGDNEHRDVVLQNLASGDLSRWFSKEYESWPDCYSPLPVECQGPCCRSQDLA